MAKSGYIGFRCTDALQKRVEDLADHYQVSVGELMRVVTLHAVKHRETRIKKGQETRDINEETQNDLENF